jgi:hypothetical protein
MNKDQKSNNPGYRYCVVSPVQGINMKLARHRKMADNVFGLSVTCLFQIERQIFPVVESFVSEYF